MLRFNVDALKAPFSLLNRPEKWQTTRVPKSFAHFSSDRHLPQTVDFSEY
jgi:hypothetical protein